MITWEKNFTSNPPSFFRGIDCITRVVAFLCGVLVVLYCAWTLDRGFDITDEAYYLLLAIYPESVKMYISAQQWITAGIWRVTGSLVAFRVAGLILLVGGASLLAFGAMVAASHNKQKWSYDAGGRMLVLASSIICSLLYVETINFSPSYNLLASSSTYAAAGMVLLALHAGKKWHRFGLLFLVGGALSVEFVSKPSSGVATLCLLAVWIFFLNPSLQGKVIGFATVLFSLILCVFILAVINTTIPEVEAGIRNGFELFRMVQDEPVGVRLTRYVFEFSRNVTHAFKDHLLLIVTVALYLIIRKLVFVVVVAAIIGYSLASAKYYLGYNGQYETLYILQMEFAFVLLALLLLVSMESWKNDRPLRFVIGGLIALPYTVGVGTGNSIFTQIINCLAPWGVAVAIVANMHFARKSDRLLVAALSMAFILAFSLQIVAGIFRAPYHLVQSMVKQDYKIDVGLLGSIKVDVETGNFMAALRLAAENCQIVPGSPFLGMYNVPGVAFALNTIPVFTPWLNNISQAEAVLKLAPVDTVRFSSVAILLNADTSFPPVPDVLGFPANFRYCGSAIFPLLIQEVQIWKHL